MLEMGKMLNQMFHLVLTVMKVDALLGNIEVLSWASCEPTSAWCLYPAMIRIVPRSCEDNHLRMGEQKKQMIINSTRIV